MSESNKVYASQKYVEEKIVQSRIQPDWNQNDPNAADYVKNRTHWCESGKTILPETQLLYNEDEEMYGITTRLASAPKIGTTYLVTVNGVVYECEGFTTVDTPEGQVCLGNHGVFGIAGGNAELDFCIALIEEPSFEVDGESWYGYAEWRDMTEPVTVAIIEKETVHTIDPKYLSDNVGTVKSVNGVLPDENGDLTVVEPQTFVFTNIDGDVDCPYEVSELIKFATNASAYKSVRFVHRVRDLFDLSVPIRDYVWTGASIPATGTGVFQINFGDEVAPILINSNDNTITLDPDWVKPEENNGGSGGSRVLIFKGSEFDNSVAGIAVAASAPEETYTANMTFDEVVTAFVKCEPIEGFVFIGGSYPKWEKITSLILNTSDYDYPCLFAGCDYGTIAWAPDGSISFT